MKKLLCRIFGHRYRYNFVSLPNKCICSRCHKKWKADYAENEIWREVDSFDGETRTDEELSNKWFK